MIDILIFSSLLLNVLFALIVVRFIKRTIQYDELLNIMMDDVQLNADFFEDLLKTPTLMNAPEVQVLHENMTIMLERFNEYVLSYTDMKSSSKKREGIDGSILHR